MCTVLLSLPDTDPVMSLRVYTKLSHYFFDNPLDMKYDLTADKHFVCILDVLFWCFCLFQTLFGKRFLGWLERLSACQLGACISKVHMSLSLTKNAWCLVYDHWMLKNKMTNENTDSDLYLHTNRVSFLFAKSICELNSQIYVDTWLNLKHHQK